MRAGSSREFSCCRSNKVPALRQATFRVARAQSISAAGQRADLILVSGNPLADRAMRAAPCQRFTRVTVSERRQSGTASINGKIPLLRSALLQVHVKLARLPRGGQSHGVLSMETTPRVTARRIGHAGLAGD